MSFSKKFLQLIIRALSLSILSIVSVYSGNPLNFAINLRTADPLGHIRKDGEMYFNILHDEEYQGDFWMKDWHVFSSSDLINWTNHGAFFSVDDLIWADNYNWASEKTCKGKYYFCFPAGLEVKDFYNKEKSAKWMRNGIVLSDSPSASFFDAIGGALREEYANDACFFVDDDGKAYNYFYCRGN